MPLILAPSFDDNSRQEIEAFLEQVRFRRIAAALVYQQGKKLKLQGEHDALASKLTRNYKQLGRVLERLENDLAKAETYLNTCELLYGEIGFVSERIKLAEK